MLSRLILLVTVVVLTAVPTAVSVTASPPDAAVPSRFDVVVSDDHRADAPGDAAGVRRAAPARAHGGVRTARAVASARARDRAVATERRASVRSQARTSAAADAAPARVSVTVPPTPSQARPPAAAPAPPVPVAPPPPRCDSACRGPKIAARLTVPLPAGWNVRYEPSRKGLLGLADPRAKVITIFVRDGASDERMAYVLHHEVGHAYDFTVLTDGDRQQWAGARGYPATGWFDMTSRSSDYGIPAGDFAEAFAACHVGAVTWGSKMGPRPDAAQCRLLAEILG